MRVVIELEKIKINEEKMKRVLGYYKLKTQEQVKRKNLVLVST